MTNKLQRKQWNKLNRAKIRRYRRNWYYKHHAHALEYHKAYRQAHPIQNATTKYHWWRKQYNTADNAAQQLRALRMVMVYGRKAFIYIKPECCEVCGIHTLRLAAHHEDYGDIDNLTWLCRKCHNKADKARRRRLGLVIAPYKRHPVFTMDQRAEMCRLYAAGISQIKIARHFDCSHTTVSKITSGKYTYVQEIYQ